MWRAASKKLLASSVVGSTAAKKATGNTETKMTKVLNLVKRFAADEEGAAMIEYAVLVGIITVAVIVTVGLLGGAVNTQLRAACNAVKNAAC